MQAATVIGVQYPLKLYAICWEVDGMRTAKELYRHHTEYHAQNSKAFNTLVAISVPFPWCVCLLLKLVSHLENLT